MNHELVAADKISGRQLFEGAILPAPPFADDAVKRPIWYSHFYATKVQQLDGTLSAYEFSVYASLLRDHVQHSILTATDEDIAGLRADILVALLILLIELYSKPAVMARLQMALGTQCDIAPTTVLQSIIYSAPEDADAEFFIERFLSLPLSYFFPEPTQRHAVIADQCAVLVPFYVTFKLCQRLRELGQAYPEQTRSAINTSLIKIGDAAGVLPLKHMLTTIVCHGGKDARDLLVFITMAELLVEYGGVLPQTAPLFAALIEGLVKNSPASDVFSRTLAVLFDPSSRPENEKKAVFYDKLIAKVVMILECYFTSISTFEGMSLAGIRQHTDFIARLRAQFSREAIDPCQASFNAMFSKYLTKLIDLLGEGLRLIETEATELPKSSIIVFEDYHDLLHFNAAIADRHEDALLSIIHAKGIANIKPFGTSQGWLLQLLRGTPHYEAVSQSITEWVSEDYARLDEPHPKFGDTLSEIILPSADAALLAFIRRVRFLVDPAAAIDDAPNFVQIASGYRLYVERKKRCFEGSMDTGIFSTYHTQCRAQFSEKVLTLCKEVTLLKPGLLVVILMFLIEMHCRLEVVNAVRARLGAFPARGLLAAILRDLRSQGLLQQFFANPLEVFFPNSAHQHAMVTPDISVFFSNYMQFNLPLRLKDLCTTYPDHVKSLINKEFILYDSGEEFFRGSNALTYAIWNFAGDMKEPVKKSIPLTISEDRYIEIADILVRNGSHLPDDPKLLCAFAKKLTEHRIASRSLFFVLNHLFVSDSSEQALSGLLAMFDRCINDCLRKARSGSGADTDKYATFIKLLQDVAALKNDSPQLNELRALLLPHKKTLDSLTTEKEYGTEPIMINRSMDDLLAFNSAMEDRRREDIEAAMRKSGFFPIDIFGSTQVWLFPSLSEEMVFLTITNIAKKLEANPSEINAYHPFYGDTWLQQAIIVGSDTLARLLMNMPGVSLTACKADSAYPDARYTPFSLACLYQRTEIARELFKRICSNEVARSAPLFNVQGDENIRRALTAVLALDNDVAFAQALQLLSSHEDLLVTCMEAKAGKCLDYLLKNADQAKGFKDLSSLEEAEQTKCKELLPWVADVPSAPEKGPSSMPATHETLPKVSASPKKPKAPNAEKEKLQEAPFRTRVSNIIKRVLTKKELFFVGGYLAEVNRRLVDSKPALTDEVISKIIEEELEKQLTEKHTQEEQMRIEQEARDAAETEAKHAKTIHAKAMQQGVTRKMPKAAAEAPATASSPAAAADVGDVALASVTLRDAPQAFFNRLPLTPATFPTGESLLPSPLSSTVVPVDPVVYAARGTPHKDGGASGAPRGSAFFAPHRLPASTDINQAFQQGEPVPPLDTLDGFLTVSWVSVGMWNPEYNTIPVFLADYDRCEALVSETGLAFNGELMPSFSIYCPQLAEKYPNGINRVILKFNNSLFQNPDSPFVNKVGLEVFATGEYFEAEAITPIRLKRTFIELAMPIPEPYAMGAPSWPGYY